MTTTTKTDAPATASPTADINRAHWEALARGETTDWEQLGTEPPWVTVERATSPDGLWLRPDDARSPEDSGGVLLAIHGGGFIGGSASTHHRMFGHLVAVSGISAFAVEYGLVPEYTFPSQVDAVFDAYRALLAGGRRIALVGDSCGATLAIGVAARARDEGLPVPAGLLLLSAWSDFEATGESYETGTDPFFTREVVRGLARGYLNGQDPRDPAAAPLFTDLRGFPPTYIQVGAEESLLDDSIRLARRLREAGVRTRVDTYEGQLHTFQMTAGRTPVADDAITEGATWLRSILNP